MIMVVFSHVLLFSFGRQSVPSFNSLFSIIMLPLFFFISGFLMNHRFRDDGKELFPFIKKKFNSVVIPTIIFQSLFAIIFFGGAMLWVEKSKSGFWFTYTLFFFFLFFSVGDFLLSRVFKEKQMLWAGVVAACMVYAFSKFSLSPSCPWADSPVSHFFGFANLQFYIFFYFGIVVGHRREAFFKLFDDSKSMAVLIVVSVLLFVLLLVPSVRDSFIGICGFSAFSVVKSIFAFVGIMMIFCFFRRYERSFSKSTYVGWSLQYIGSRTLDIYLLHLFFIRFDLNMVGDFLSLHGNPILELVLGLAYSLLIIGICSVISNLLRCSDALAKLLFGKVIPPEHRIQVEK